MTSESATASLMENLMNSRNNRDVSVFLPFILSFTNNTNSSNPIQDSSNPDHETDESTNLSDRIILVNPVTQSMIIMETRPSSTLEAFMNELRSKEGQPPASKASIDALPIVEICEENEKEECVVCLDEFGEIEGLVVKEMPCKHRFHGNCVEKWLRIHGTCPICRYKMPEEEISMNFSTGNNQTVSDNFNSENEQDHASEA